MAENLWALRKKRNMKVGQLASKSGIPAKQIIAYEKGERIKVAHKARLARALFIDQEEIKWESEPEQKKKPKPKPKPAPKTKPTAKPAQNTTKASAPPKKIRKTPAMLPARPTQLEYLRNLLDKLGIEETAVAEEIGKPLDELNQGQAGRLLSEYTRQWTEYRKAHPPGTLGIADNQGKRAILPEGIDRFEYEYLEARQEAGDILTFTLFDGSVKHGRILGFTPYFITIQEENGDETTIQRLALAYYTRAAGEGAAETEAEA
ncbi:MAG: helix-turn-helix transcriptional regulator [Chloroflexi bacterium]|nr:helix-turn-helix transcriptional regulator [Chloroflexota bacterium]